MAFASAQAQNLYSYNFDNPTASLPTDGWVRTNQSTSASTTLWTVASYAAVTVSATVQALPFQNQAYTTGQTCPPPNGQDATPNKFALVNFTSTSSTAATGATISNWLISPIVTVDNGDVISFYTRLGKFSATGTASFPDNLQLRMSTNGAFTTDPAGGPTNVGDYTEVLVDVNPALDLTSYPTSWEQFTYIVTGLTGPTDVKLAFRYFVTDGGSNGNNSDIIGLDTFSVDRPLSTDSFFKGNFAATPNPANDVLNITNHSNIAVNAIQITDMNGRVVKEVKGMTSQINVSELNAGVYFLKVSTDQGTGTTKIIKK
ncbi:choice-of-anchor J domain-containing protein [Flavobacterium sp.]|uniref:T9SS-dependent choice-of-anchor J family protein n=1 Tax=Flavobacterium sp. TaxID=239 RepID=UPI0026367DD7|nr:choice-of-anchor J domain-containing protein [Flavobacterium sp.]